MNRGQLTFFGGLRATGVQLLYGAGNRGLLFDFGIAHRGLIRAPHVFTHDPIRPTPKRAVRQYVLGRMAPPLPQLYDTAQAKLLDRKAMQKAWNHRRFPHYEDICIFISHMHQDHMALLPYAREGMTVYMHEDAYALYRGIVAAREYGSTKANITSLKDLSVMDFGEFSMQLVEVDHNTPGASGIIIESRDHVIAFSGDWRRNGRHPERIDRFIQMCKEKNVDILITETTKVQAQPQASAPPPRKESEVIKMYADVLDDARGLVYVQTLSRDIERMAELITVTYEAGRKIAMDAQIAAIWQQTISQDLSFKKAIETAISVDISVIDDSLSTSGGHPYETKTLDQLAAAKQDYVYFLAYPHLPHLIELETLGEDSGQSHYVHMNHPASKENSALDLYLQAYSIQFHSLGNSGHASPEEITDFVRQINPQVVIPVHGQNSTSLRTPGIRRFYPERGDTWAIEEILTSATE